MSTENCKNFLKSEQVSVLFKPDSIWKRTSKKKVDALEQRTFVNQYGEQAIVVTADDVSYSLLSYQTRSIPEYSARDLVLEVVKKVVEDEHVSSECLASLDAFLYATPGVTQQYLKEHKEAILKTALEKTVLKSGTAVDFVADYYIEVCQEPCSTHWLSPILSQYCGVNFSEENVNATLEKVNSRWLVCLEIGGDWEIPVQALIYLDANKQLNCILPKAPNNTYNEKTSTAYGSENDEDDTGRESFEEILEKIDVAYPKLRYAVLKKAEAILP